MKARNHFLRTNLQKRFYEKAEIQTAETHQPECHFFEKLMEQIEKLGNLQNNSPKFLPHRRIKENIEYAGKDGQTRQRFVFLPSMLYLFAIVSSLWFIRAIVCGKSYKNEQVAVKCPHLSAPASN